jgi:hypothetical protein
VEVALGLAVMLLGTAAYIGLAAVGRGGVTAFFSDPALGALAAATLALTAAATGTAGPEQIDGNVSASRSA